MRARVREACIFGSAVVAAVLTLGLPSPSATAADRQPVSFSLIVIGDESDVEEQGSNHAVIDLRFSAVEFNEYSGPDGRFAANPHLRMRVHWNTTLGRGHVSGTLSTMHFFDPVRWEGKLWGHLTESGGEGTLHMTEVNSGMKLKATWTIPALDPLTDVPGGSSFFVASGTASA